MGSAQSVPPKKGKLSFLRGIARQARESKDGGRRPPSPVVLDPAPWVEGHKTFVLLKDGQGHFVEADTVFPE